MADHTSNLDQPATKQELKKELADLRTELKQDLADVRVELKTDMDAMESRIIEHFNVVAEQIRADVGAANNDEISQLTDRVTQLEEHTGITT